MVGAVPFWVNMLITLLLADGIAAIAFAWWFNTKFFFYAVTCSIVCASCAGLAAVFIPEGVWLAGTAGFAMVVAVVLVWGWLVYLRRDARQRADTEHPW